MSRFVALASGTLLVAATTSAVAQERKPTKTQGLEEMRLEQFSLPLQVSSGYELRARRIVFAPGGTVVEHAHAERPGIVYVLQGSMTEHRGDSARLVKAGETWVEDAGTVHWLENTSNAPCVFVSVDLVRK